MKNYIVFIFIIGISHSIFAQADESPFNFYIGGSYGTSFSIGDFSDSDIKNMDAGFAQNGQKIELYGGKFINDTINLTGTFRYQRFRTETDDLLDEFSDQNPGVDFNGNTGNWETYSLLLGATYKVQLNPKLDFYPRIGIGPILAINPEINISSNSTNAINFIHSSETGFGVGYEFGIGTSTELGKHFVLLPTFTFSGGIITIADVETISNNQTEIRNFKPKIHSFNLGFSIAYRFY